MGNPYFSFKQFTIRQEHAAMKVSTDACVFGAWLAKRQLQADHALDIGCGTGLLMGMVAQQWSATRITGIEIDPLAAQEAQLNLAATPWQNRMEVFCGDVKSYAFREKFSCIFSNPPFYAQQLKSDTHRINLARHAEGLTLEELLGAIGKNLDKGGHAAILLPYTRAELWISLAHEVGLHLVERLDLKQSIAHGYFRSCMLFQDGYQGPCTSMDMAIQDGKGNYTPEAIDLLKPYYLYL